MKRVILFVTIFLMLSSFALAHNEDEELAKDSIFIRPMTYLTFALAWLAVFTIYLIVNRKRLASTGEEDALKKDKHSKEKKAVFFLMIIPIILATLYSAGYTIYENVVSESGGPVHWHADIHVWACGQKLDLIDPSFPKNKIGTTLLHEHNDERVHVEGTLKHIRDVSLHNYFDVIGGELGDNNLAYPTNEGVVSYKDGDLCSDGAVGTLKVYINGKRTENYQNYVFYPDSYVPPGDCIVVEFGAGDGATTDKSCESWEVKGWEYENFKRLEVTIGGHTWN